jgi:DNA-directed RNA polymerase subunit L
MISKFTIDKENMGFMFKDRDCSILELIRRYLIGGIHVHTLNVTSVETNSENINHEQIKKMMRLSYVNQNKITNDGMVFKMEYKCEDDYVKIFSNKIKFYNAKGKEIKPIIRTDLYLFTMIRGEHISFKGNLKMEMKSLIGFMSKKMIDDHTFKCGMNILELFTPYQTISAALDILLENITKFKSIYKKKGEKISLGKHYDVSDFDRGLLNAIAVEVNQDFYEDVINCGVYVKHYSMKEKKLRLEADNPDKLLEFACDNIIKKAKNLQQQVDKEISNKKGFNIVIDNY